MMLDILRYAKLTNEMSKPPYWDPKHVIAVQQKRLRALLKHAASESAFYRDRLKGLDLDRVRLQDLPTLNKEDVRTHFDEVVTDPRITRSELEDFVADEANLGTWYLGRYCVSHTSGSQGSPLLIVQDKPSLVRLFSIMGARLSTVRKPGISEGIKRFYEPKRVAIVTFRRGFYPSSAALDFMQQIVGRFAKIERFSSMQPDLIDRLNESQPHVLVSYAGVLEALAMQEDKLIFTNLEQISNSSEQLTVRARKRIKEAFGVPVLDHYGTGECLQMADGCVCGNVHINSDWCIVEVVDENNEPVPDGTLGHKILVTNLANYTQPFIRYDVDDRVAIARNGLCPCGSRLPFFKQIEGRSSDMLWIDVDGEQRFYSGVLFHSAIDTINKVREWRVIQTNFDSLTIQLQLLPTVPFTETEQIANKVTAKLHEFGLPESVTISVQIVPEIRADANTGKLRRIVPLQATRSLTSPT